MNKSQIVSLTFAATLALAVTDSVLAGTVILGGDSGGGLTNLVVTVPPSNTMIVRASTVRYGVTVSSGGQTFRTASDTLLDTSVQSRYLAGPCTFTYTKPAVSLTASIFNYDVVPTSGIQTLVKSDSEPSTIQVPSGKRLRLLDGSYPISFSVTLTNGVSAEFSVRNPASGYDSTLSPEGFEIAGPVTLSVWKYGSGENYFVTYYFASDVTQTVGQSVQTPVGSVVTVEKSIDLQTWQPAFIVTEKSAPKAFYRFKAVR